MQGDQISSPIVGKAHPVPLEQLSVHYFPQQGCRFGLPST